jgi:hypothetical protein
MLDSRSTNGSMTLSQSGCGSQMKLDKYNSTYEDLITGKVANVDPKRLEVRSDDKQFDRANFWGV